MNTKGTAYGTALAFLCLGLLSLASCRPEVPPQTVEEAPAAAEKTVRLEPRAEARDHEDGRYRGIFADGPDIQVNVEFTLEDGVITEAGFRHLRRDDNYNIDADEEPYRSVVSMYQESLDYLVGKRLEDHLTDLYAPGEIVTVEVDGYSGATIRSAKIISAIRDALNRGVYSY